MAKIVFFDFDGTITKKDSLIEFLKFALGSFEYYKGLIALSPILLVYKLKIIPNHIAKEKLIAHFFKGCDSIHFNDIANRYSIEEIDKIIRPKALEKITWHIGKGHKVVVVSASMECWLKGWCDKNNLELLGTKLAVREGQMTGGFSTKNCYGIEKVNRIEENFNLDDYDVIYAYGDSTGDREMLSIADEKYYKYFENS